MDGVDTESNDFGLDLVEERPVVESNVVGIDFEYSEQLIKS